MTGLVLISNLYYCYYIYLLTLGAHAPEGYGSCPVCVYVCLSATLIWGLGLVEV